MTPEPLSTIGPLRIADVDVLIRTNCTDFATVAGSVFAGLLVPSGTPRPSRRVTFETVCHRDPAPHWSIRRDGQACEMDLMDEGVLIHQQWELNRLAIESVPTSIHGAAVAVAGRAVLLVGQSHSGKTTLAAWLASRHGAGFIADEVAGIDDRGCVLPFARPLGIRADGPFASDRRRGDHAARDHTVHRFMPDEQLVPVTELGGAVWSSAARIGLLVFPRYDRGSALSVRRLSEADALLGLAALTPGVVQHGRAVFECLSGVVSSVAAIELRYGDVRSAAPIVVDALSETAGLS